MDTLLCFLYDFIPEMGIPLPGWKLRSLLVRAQRYKIALLETIPCPLACTGGQA